MTLRPMAYVHMIIFLFLCVALKLQVMQKNYIDAQCQAHALRRLLKRQCVNYFQFQTTEQKYQTKAHHIGLF